MRSSDLDTIRKRCRDDPDECFTEVIKCWLRGCEHKPTWSNIIAALKAKSVGFSDLAKEIEKKLQHMDTDHSEETKTEMDDNTKQANEFFHCPCGRCSLESYLEKGCQYTHSSNSLFPYLDVKNLDEDVKDDIIQTLNNDLAKIMNCFAELLDKTAVSIGRRGEPAVIVERLILRALSVGAFDHPCIQKPLLKENEIELKCSKTVDAAFIILRHHMSFFNFELLQHIINSEELCTHEDRKRMEVYCSKFDEFCRRKVFEVPPDVYGQPRSDCKRNSFVVLMTRHEEERNLICVRAAKHKIANILKLKVSTLHLHRIDEGSLLLVFSVPEFVAHCLFPLSDSLKAGLKEEGYIIYSTLSSEPCLFKDKEMPLINQLMLKDEPIKSHAISPIDDSSLLEDRHTSLREQPSNILLADYPYGKKNLILEEGYIIFSTLSSEPCLFKDKEMPLINQLTLKDEPIKSHAISPFDDSSLLEDRHTLLREQPSNIPPADYPYGLEGANKETGSHKDAGFQSFETKSDLTESASIVSSDTESTHSSIVNDDTQVKLYISGLPPDYTKRKVRRLFKRLDCGNVLQNVILFYDKETKQSKCSGLVVISPASASSTVIETANGVIIDDHHKLNIRIYREDQRRSRSESSSEKSICRQKKDSDTISGSTSRQRRDSHQRTKSKRSKEVSAPKKQLRSTIILDNFPDYLGEVEIEAITDCPDMEITINVERKCAVLVLPKGIDPHHICSKWDGKVFLGESIHAYIIEEDDQSQDREQQSESSLFDTETSTKPQSRRRRRERRKDKNSSVHKQEGDKDRINVEVCSVPSAVDLDELSVPVHSLNEVNHDGNEQLIKEPHSVQTSRSEEDMSSISSTNRQGDETAEHHIHCDTKESIVTTVVNPKATNLDDFSCLPQEKEMPIVKQVPSMPADINTEKDFTNAMFHINCIMSKENFIKFMQHHLNSAILNEVEVKEVKHNQDEQSSSMIVQFPSHDTATSAIEWLQNNSDLIGEICEPEKSSAEVLFKEKISEFKQSIESKSKFFLAKHISKTEKLIGERKKQNIPKRCPAHVFQDITAKREVLDQAIVECDQQHTEFITYCSHLNTRLNELEVEAAVLTTDSDWKRASEQSLSEKLSNLRKKFGNECSRLERALPMYAYRTHILEVIQKQGHQVIILIGETGSGKSTQLVQYIHEHEVASSGIIVCTQPRKVAAISLAKHVSTEMGVALGQTLGYKTGLRGNNSEKTKVIYMTDHTLLNECIADPTFSKYSCLIIDEAHERSLSTDLLLAFIKKCLPKRPDLKVIITSATIDPKIFDEYFGGSCPIITVPGRTYPVEIVWNPLKSDKSPLDRDYVSDCVNIACQLHASEPPGDILVFLTSAAEIERACQSTTDKLGDNAIVLPLHGKLPPEEQQKVFQVDDQRKIVFATNVAETSVTIPGVKYIVDTGLAKELCFDPKKNMNSLEVRIISKSSAEQRKGRAGRTSAGKCYRLYSETQYNEMPSKSLPEILRVTLETTALKLHEFGVADVLSFDFVEEPDRIALVKAVDNLQFLEAIRDGHLTELGKKMAALPIDPHLSRIMLDGINWGIGLEAAVSAAISTLAGSVFFRAGTEEMKQESDMKTITFCHPAGDQMTYLQTYFQWAAEERANQNKWCVEHSVNAKSMRMVRELVKEFRDILRLQFNIILEDHPFNPDITEEVLPKLYFDTFIRNICIFLGHERVGYLNINLPNERLFIFHGSPLRQLNVVPKVLVYEKTLVTSQHFLLQALPVRAEWIYEAIESGKLPCHPSDTALYNQHCMVPVMASNLGRNSLRRLQKNWKSNKTVLDITKPVEPQVDYDYKQGIMKVFVPICHQDLVSQLLLAEVSEIKKELKGEICEKGVTKDDDSVRVILACGVSVKYVLMPDQYRTVMIKGASAGTTYREEILQALKQFGVIERESRNFKNDHQLFVTFTSPESACEAVKSSQDQLELPDVIIQPYTPYQRQQDSMSAFTLHVEWCRRARKQHAFVNFDNEEDFSIAVQRFCIPAYAACYGIQSMKFRPSKDGKPQLFVTNVNLYVTEDQMNEAIQARLPEVSDDKFKVLIGYEKAFETTPQQLRELKQKLDELVSPHAPSGKYRIFLNQPKNFFKTYKAQIKFENPDEGYSALKHIQFAYIENHVLSVKAELSSTVRYSSEVYSVIEKSIQEVANEIHSRYRSVRVDHGKRDDKGKTIVRVTSEDVNTFIITKHALNSVISPFVMNCSKPELREFIQTANCKRALEKIEAETSTYIRIDTRRATISMYGYQSNITKAQIEFNKCLSFLDDGAKCFEVRLKEAGRPPGLMKHLVSLFGPGLRQLQEREGATTVRLDPRRQLVTVFATQQVYEFLNGKIDEYTKSFDPNSLSTIHHHKFDEIECCVCFTDIINPSDIFRLEYCGHTYCIDCIKLQLAPYTVDFPIVCAADGCSEALVWKDVYNLSDQTGFNIRHLINASVRSYVAANQDKVHNCPSPDCSMIYSVTKNGKCFFCQQCGAMVCTTCHEPYHEGITCAMYQSGKQADKDLEDWLQRDPSNRKRCPKCSSPIEKMDGCNHISCQQCRAHICWFCLDYFSSSGECYGHMSAKHGDFGLE